MRMERRIPFQRHMVQISTCRRLVELIHKTYQEQLPQGRGSSSEPFHRHFHV